MKSVVLLSAGLDSTVNLYQAHKKGKVLLALTFDYGQKAAPKEIQSARKLTQELGISHEVVKLPFFKTFQGSSLISREKKIPLKSQVQIHNLERSRKTAKSVWVPNRNGIFLNIAAGFAESLKAETVVPGFNLEEASTFPDNTQGFLDQLTKSFSFSTSNHIKAHCFTTGLQKSEIVKLGIQLKVNWKHVWPCYQSLRSWCGECESCQRARRAFLSQGLELFK